MLLKILIKLKLILTMKQAMVLSDNSNSNNII